MINKGEVPEGYKKTKVGIIPEDWEVKRLGEIAEIISGGTPSTTVETYWDGEIPWCTPTDITSSSKYIENTTRYISSEGLNNSSAQLLPANSILMCSRATIGPRSINKIPMTTNQGFKSFVCKEDELYFEFLYYLLGIYVPILIRKSNGSTFLEISKRDTEKIEVAVSRLSEQQKIAQILSTWDETIELKEKLIEEKKEQKKGLMQKLLTGEVRLAGFDGEWEEVRLGEVLKERKETGYNNLELLAITSDKGIVRRDEIDLKDTSSNDKSKYKRIIPLDIGYNTMRMWQGVSGVSEYEGIVSPAYTILKPTCKVDSYFMGYLFKVPEIINLFKRYSQGLVNDTLNLKYNNFKIIKVKIPKSLQEQKAIAQILTTADKEIELLTQELEQLKLQKKGLMQLLLTGIIRVKS